MMLLPRTFLLLLGLLVHQALSFTIPATTTLTSTQTSTQTTVALHAYVKCGKCQATYELAEDDLGRGKGRRLECAVCGHSWFQSKDRMMELKDGFELVPLPEGDLQRIEQNLAEGKAAGFVGESKVYVGNIAFECHEDDLEALFSQVGEVGDVSLVRDDEGKNRGFGFVTMRTEEGGQAAIAELDGATVRGRRIAVRESNN